VHTKIDYLTYSNGLQFSNLTYADQLSLERACRRTAVARCAGRWWLSVPGKAECVPEQPPEHRLCHPVYAQPEGQQSGAVRRCDLFHHGPPAVERRRALYPSNQEPGRLDHGQRPVHHRCGDDHGAGGQCTTGATPAAPILFNNIYYFPTNFCVVANGGNYNDKNVSWKAGIEVDPRPGSLLYANVRTGFRAGGFTVGTQNNYKPEHLTAYEIGSKNRFFGGKLQLNASAFYWRYKDQQVSQLQLYYLNGIAIGQTSYPSNFNGNLYGAEVDVQAMVTPDDHIAFDALWAKGKYDSTPPVATVNTSTLTRNTTCRATICPNGRSAPIMITRSAWRMARVWFRPRMSITKAARCCASSTPRC
jgi:iron complex outermembrane receptor protein